MNSRLFITFTTKLLTVNKFILGLFLIALPHFLVAQGVTRTTYHDSGDLKEVGEYKQNKRSGPWKTYFEDGTLRGETDYSEDHGRFTEYYHSGKVMAEGPKAGPRNVGHWRYFAEDGTLEEEGDYSNNKKNGEWKYYYSSGKISSSGLFENDEPAGKWNYYFEDGKVSC